MDKVELIRTNSDTKQTLGTLFFNGVEVAKTLELAWNDNERKISCIPVGEYTVVRRSSNKHGNHFHLTDVPDRDLILIHKANYYKELLGCVGVGAKHLDINSDGYKDLTNSRITLIKLLKILPQQFILVVKNE